MHTLTQKEISDLIEIRRRLGDYSRVDFKAERDKLVQLWREAHPEAAKEQSAALHPLMLLWEGSRKPKTGDPLQPSEPNEEWGNDVYNITVRRWETDPVFGTHGGMIQIGISSLDGTAKHDWRDFQAIKNQLAGPECEAFELYPAESRLLDPSNYYTLWCFPGLKRIKVGRPERGVRDAHEAIAPQRALPKQDS